MSSRSCCDGSFGLCSTSPKLQLVRGSYGDSDIDLVRMLQSAAVGFRRPHPFCPRKNDAHGWAACTPLTTPCSEAEPFKCGLAGNMPSFPQPRLVKPTPASVRVVLPQASARASRAPQGPKRSQPPHRVPLAAALLTAIPQQGDSDFSVWQSSSGCCHRVRISSHALLKLYNIFGCSLCHYSTT